MKRSTLVALVLGIGALSMVASAQRGGPPPFPSGPTDAAKAATKLQKVKDNFYVLTGSSADNPNAFSGGNTSFFVMDNGVAVIDTKLAGWGQFILDQIKTVTNKPVTLIINTHAHGDHVGSNEFFGATVDSVVQENTKQYMATQDAFKGDKAKFLPKRTFKDKVTVGTGKNEIDLYYFGRGHTGGDAWVVFPSLRVVAAGDMFAERKPPLVDRMNGGSQVDFPETLTKAYSTIKNADTVIMGHTWPAANWADVKEYADFNRDFVTWAQGEMKAGKTPQQAAAEYKIPAKYKGYSAEVPPFFGGLSANVQAVYDESKK
jgi:glyoxylase-like metal-dependent hydrolase (beta-lactamase superfamily II)